jgi:hypothetical protein
MALVGKYKLALRSLVLRNISMRIFRVLEHKGDSCSSAIVYEDEASCQFWLHSYSGYIPPEQEMEPDAGEDLRIIENLKNPETRIGNALAGASDSIDGAIEGFHHAFEEMIRRTQAGLPPEMPKPTGPPPKHVVAIRSVSTRKMGEVESRNLIRARQEAIARMKAEGRVRWKLIDPTPAGRRCQVLTIDGSDIFTVPLSSF